MAEPLNLFVKLPDGKTKNYNLDINQTVSGTILQIQSKEDLNNKTNQRMSYNGKILKDDIILKDLGIKRDDTLHLTYKISFKPIKVPIYISSLGTIELDAYPNMTFEQVGIQLYDKHGFKSYIFIVRGNTVMSDDYLKTHIMDKDDFIVAICSRAKLSDELLNLLKLIEFSKIVEKIVTCKKQFIWYYERILECMTKSENQNSSWLNNYTPLHHIADYDGYHNVDIIKYILDNYPELNSQTDDKILPIHLSVTNGKIPMVKLLLNHRLDDLNIEFPYSNSTLLYESIKANNVRMSKLLIKKGANIDCSISFALSQSDISTIHNVLYTISKHHSKDKSLEIESETLKLVVQKMDIKTTINILSRGHTSSTYLNYLKDISINWIGTIIESHLNNPPTCSICYTEFGESHSTVLKCGHPFCFECIEQWFEYNETKSCPNCRSI